MRTNHTGYGSRDAQFGYAYPIVVDLSEPEVLIDGDPQANDPADHLQDHVDGPLEAVVATHPLQIISGVNRASGGI